MSRAITGKDFMSLKSAATEAGCEESEIWSNAIDGRLKLSITVPVGYAVWSMARIHLEPWRYSTDIFHENVMDRMPKKEQSVVLLNLSEKDCKSLTDEGSVDQGGFFSGYTLGYVIWLDYVSLDAGGKSGENRGMRDRMFVLYKEESPPGRKGTSLAKIKRVRVDATDVVVAGEQFAKFKKYINSKQESTPVALPNRLDQHDWTSAKIVYLNQVALDVWDMAIKDDGVYPSPDGVKAKIRKKFREAGMKFSPAIIERAATMIRPWGLREGIQEAIDTTDDSYMTEEFKLMVDASNAKWGNADISDSSTYPIREEIISWVKDKAGTVKYSKKLADTIAFLIRPEGAKKGRRAR